MLAFPSFVRAPDEDGVSTETLAGLINRPEGQPSLAVHEEWGANGTGIINEYGYQNYPRVVNDGAGGAIITWSDSSSGGHAQKVNSMGTRLWPTGGVLNFGSNLPVAITSDGAGGAIIAWATVAFLGSSVFAQRVDAGGNILWGTDPIYYGEYPSSSPCIVGDGTGGVILTWSAELSDLGPAAVFAQRLNSTGDKQWGAVARVGATSTNQYDPHLVGDGNGGAIIAWYEARSDWVNYDIYSQHLNSTGGCEWGLNGTTICNATNIQYVSSLASDGEGGAIISWIDNRSGYYDIYAQSINNHAEIQWDNNGTAVSTAEFDQINLQSISDGAGGAIFTWQDYRSGAGVAKIYAQKVNFKGNIDWETYGNALASTPYNQTNPQMISDENGGAIIVWQDYRNGSSTSDIYAQRLNSKGAPMWADNGRAVCTAAYDQLSPQLASDGAGGAIIVWQDARNPLWGPDIYAQRMSNVPPAANHPADMATSSTGSDTIGWVLTDDQKGGQYHVWANHTSGGYYEWRAWTAWTNNTALNIPINRTAVGTFSYTIEYFDDQGAWGPPDTVIVTVVSPPSALSVAIEWGLGETGSTSVTLALFAAGATEMCFSNDGASYSSWESYSTSKAWVLAGGPGVKTVFFKARNLTVESGPVTDSITYILPPAHLFLFINYGATETDNASVTLILSATDATEMCFSNNGTTYTPWEPYATSRAWMLTSGVGPKTVYFKARNGTIEAATPVTDTISLVPSSGETSPEDNGLTIFLIALIVIIGASAVLLLMMQTRKISQLKRTMAGFTGQAGKSSPSRDIKELTGTTSLAPEPKQPPIKTSDPQPSKPPSKKIPPTPEPKSQLTKPPTPQVTKPQPVKAVVPPKPKAPPTKSNTVQSPKPPPIKAPGSPESKAPRLKAPPAKTPKKAPVKTPVTAEAKDQLSKTAPVKKARAKKTKP